MQNGIELIRAESNGEKPFVVVRTIQKGEVVDQKAIKESLKLQVEAGLRGTSIRPV